MKKTILLCAAIFALAAMTACKGRATVAEKNAAASDEAYAAVVFYTNAYAALNPDRREAADLVRRMSEDLDYFRRHAMSDPHKSKKEPQPSEGDTPADTVATEA